MRKKNHHLDVTRHGLSAASEPHFGDVSSDVRRGLSPRLVADLTAAQLARLALRRAWALTNIERGAVPVLYAAGES